MPFKLFEFLEQLMIGNFFDKDNSIWEKWIKKWNFYFAGSKSEN